ncbi:MAG: hypothetical protein OEW21_13135 [Betaproteobacteria bacterium]|nr:hypothetical protein [Betaproteobacteria bacterium]
MKDRVGDPDEGRRRDELSLDAHRNASQELMIVLRFHRGERGVNPVGPLFHVSNRAPGHPCVAPFQGQSAAEMGSVHRLRRRAASQGFERGDRRLDGVLVAGPGALNDLERPGKPRFGGAGKGLVRLSGAA